MHHVVLERWSRGASFVHARDARAKTLASIALLILIATAGSNFHMLAITYLVLLSAVAALARLPVAGALRRAAVVLPFSLAFALISWISGDAQRALLLIEKSYLSSLTVILLVGCTPLAELLRGLESMYVPRFLLMVVQFLYRYLFVVIDQAAQMRMAIECRGGIRGQGDRFRAAAGALAVLFARSYARAEHIHRSMIARGFEGHFHLLSTPRFRFSDAAFLAVFITVALAARIAVERLSA